MAMFDYRANVYDYEVIRTLHDLSKMSLPDKAFWFWFNVCVLHVEDGKFSDEQMKLLVEGFARQCSELLSNGNHL